MSNDLQDEPESISNSMTPCNSCLQPIPYKASVCYHCGRNQKSIWRYIEYFESIGIVISIQ